MGVITVYGVFMEKSVKVDFLNFTSRIGLEKILPLFVDYPHKLQSNDSGFYGYAASFRAPGLMVLYTPGRSDVHVQLTGEGCELCEHKFDFLPHDAKITRLDIACDVYDGSFTVDDVWGYLQRGQFSSTSTTFLRMVGLREGSGDTLYIGSKTSDRRLRVYDKNAEQNITDKAESTWVRYELQLRRESAQAAWEKMQVCIKSTFNGLMLRMCSLLERCPTIGEIANCCKNQIPLLKNWHELFDNDSPLMLSIPSPLRTLNGLVTYVRNATGVLKMFRSARGDFYDWFDGLIDDAVIKEKHQSIFIALVDSFAPCHDYLFSDYSEININYQGA
jgi:hypothetical protein